MCEIQSFEDGRDLFLVIHVRIDNVSHIDFSDLSRQIFFFHGLQSQNFGAKFQIGRTIFKLVTSGIQVESISDWFQVEFKLKSNAPVQEGQDPVIRRIDIVDLALGYATYVKPVLRRRSGWCSHEDYVGYDTIAMSVGQFFKTVIDDSGA